MTEKWKWWRDDYQKNVIFSGPVSYANGKRIRVRIWPAPDMEKTADDVVRVVNSHDRLVEALEGFVADSDDVDDEKLPAISAATVVRARQALAEAKK